MRFLVFVPSEKFKDESLSKVRMFLDRWGEDYKIFSYARVCKGYHGAICKADICASPVSVEDYDGIIMIDGRGIDANRTYEYRPLLDMVTQFAAEGKLVVAINNAVKIIARTNTVKGRKIAVMKVKELGEFVSLFRGVPSGNPIEFSGNTITINDSESRLEESLDKMFKRLETAGTKTGGPG